MISLRHLNKFNFIVIIFTVFILKVYFIYNNSRRIYSPQIRRLTAPNVVSIFSQGFQIYPYNLRSIPSNTNCCSRVIVIKSRCVWEIVDLLLLLLASDFYIRFSCRMRFLLFAYVGSHTRVSRRQSSIGCEVFLGTGLRVGIFGSLRSVGASEYAVNRHQPSTVYDVCLGTG